MTNFKRITVARLKELFKYRASKGKAPSITVTKKDWTTGTFTNIDSWKDGDIEIQVVAEGIYTGRYVAKQPTTATTQPALVATPANPDASKTPSESLPTFRLTSIDQAKALQLLNAVNAGTAKLTRKKGYIAIKQENVEQHILMKDAISQYCTFTNTNPAILA